MTMKWLATLKVNPLPALLDWPDEASTYFANRDLGGKQVSSLKTLWSLPEVTRFVSKQQEDGAWSARFTRLLDCIHLELMIAC